MLEFSEAGYLEVHRDGVLVSKHRQEREAVESILRHCAGTVSGTYEIRRPVVRVKYTAPAAPSPDPAPTVGVITGGGEISPRGAIL
jgi:hypothetical protein